MTTRAKFRLQSITDFGAPVARKLTFYAVWDDSIPENARFAKATPSGMLEMTVDNPEALKMFEGKINKHFYLDISHAE